MVKYEHILDATGRVRPECVDDLLVEVIGGRLTFAVGREMYASVFPGMAIMDQARMVYVRVLHDAKTIWNLMSRAELAEQAQLMGAFDPQEQEQKRALESLITHLISSRDMTPNAQQKKMLDIQIAENQKILQEIAAIEDAVFGNSAESKAEDARAAYLTFMSTKKGYFLNDPAWPAWEDFQKCDDPILLLEARNAHYRVFNGLSMTVIRALARTGQWRQRWRATKESNSPIFEGPTSTWDPNKIALVQYSNFYDTISQHPDFPGEDLFFDEAALQTWVNEKMEEATTRKQQSKQVQPSAGTFRDGSGRVIPSQSLGQQTLSVKQGYRVRTRTKETGKT